MTSLAKDVGGSGGRPDWTTNNKMTATSSCFFFWFPKMCNGRREDSNSWQGRASASSALAEAKPKKATAGQIDGRTGGDQPAQGAVESKKHISKVSIQDNNSNGASGSASFGCFVRENRGWVELGVELGWNQFHLDRRLLGGDPPLRRIGGGDADGGGDAGLWPPQPRTASPRPGMLCITLVSIDCVLESTRRALCGMISERTSHCRRPLGDGGGRRQELRAMDRSGAAGAHSRRFVLCVCG